MMKSENVTVKKENNIFKRIFCKLKNLFVSREFLEFCLIGFVAYLVHQIVYTLYILVIPFDDNFHIISNGFAFIIASIASYVLNAKIVFKQKSDSKKILYSTITYLIKFLVTEGVTLLTMFILQKNLNDTDTLYKVIELSIPVITTAVTLIFQFVCFKFIFKPKENDTNADDSC